MGDLEAATASSAPDIRLVLGEGLSVPAARGRRLRVREDGALVLVEVERHRVVATPGEVTRAVLLEGPTADRVMSGGFLTALRALPPIAAVRGRLLRRHLRVVGAPDSGVDPSADLTAPGYGGVVVLLGHRGPLAAWRLIAVTPWAADGPGRRRTSGSDALALALGTVIEPAAPADVPDAAAVRDVLLERPVLPRAMTASLVLGACLSLVLAFRAAAGETQAAPVLGLAALALGLPAVLTRAVLRRRFLTLAHTAPGPDGRAVHRPGYATRPGDVRQVQLGPQDVVVVTGAGREWWLPGPRRDGITQALIGADDVQLLDARGDVLHALDRADLLPDTDDEASWDAACTVAGIHVNDVRPLTVATANLAVRLRGDDPWRFPTPAATGELPGPAAGLAWTTAVLLALAALRLVVDPAPGSGSSGAGPTALLLGWLAWVVTTTWTDISLWAWRRSVGRADRHA